MSTYGRQLAPRGPPKVEEVKTICASNVSSRASDKELMDFFGYCGQISHMGVHLDPQNPGSKRVVVTYKDESGAEMALLLTDSVFHDQEISICTVKVSPSRFTIGELKETFTSLIRPKTGQSGSLSVPVSPGFGALEAPSTLLVTRSHSTGLRRKKKSGGVAGDDPQRVSGTEEAMEETLERFSKRVKEMTQTQKTAAAGSLVLATAGAIFIGKKISHNRKREKEMKTRSLIAAYDHLFRCGPGGCCDS
eukprot:TRINITY_DN2763_c2_g1_i1.p1 TRINITY_DN2763_c2_g1~~TRINITY_DN2763_c2_g1_i1.p1  ORF type:complete len:249 (+),score=69.59 TRINITY_DN2763_c2_g1_i1:41-787(+)